MGLSLRRPEGVRTELIWISQFCLTSPSGGGLTFGYPKKPLRVNTYPLERLFLPFAQANLHVTPCPGRTSPNPSGRRAVRLEAGPPTREGGAETTPTRRPGLLTPVR